MKGIKIRFSDERGAATIIVAIALSFLLVFCAFAVDFGVAYANTAKTQNAADAAALASGKALPVQVGDSSAISQAKNVAISYANKNGGFTITAENVELGNIINGRFTSVRVSIPTQSDMYFGKIIGAAPFQFTRSAKVQIAPASQAGNLNPLGVEKTQLENAIASGNTNHIYLKYGGGDGTTGSYGAIDLDGVMGGGANDFDSWLFFGYNGIIKVNDGLLPVEKGNMAGPTKDAIAQKYNACTHFQNDGGCTAEHYDADCPRVLRVLVIEKVNKSYIRVVGFAAFVIEGYYEDEVLGSYVPIVVSGSVDYTNAPDYGVYNISLTE